MLVNYDGGLDTFCKNSRETLNEFLHVKKKYAWANQMTCVKKELSRQKIKKKKRKKWKDKKMKSSRVRQNFLKHKTEDTCRLYVKQGCWT